MAEPSTYPHSYDVSVNNAVSLFYHIIDTLRFYTVHCELGHCNRYCIGQLMKLVGPFQCFEGAESRGNIGFVIDSPFHYQQHSTALYTATIATCRYCTSVAIEQCATKCGDANRVEL